MKTTAAMAALVAMALVAATGSARLNRVDTPEAEPCAAEAGTRGSGENRCPPKTDAEPEASQGERPNKCPVTKVWQEGECLDEDTVNATNEPKEPAGEAVE